MNRLLCSWLRLNRIVQDSLIDLCSSADIIDSVVIYLSGLGCVGAPKPTSFVNHCVGFTPTLIGVYCHVRSKSMNSLIQCCRSKKLNWLHQSAMHLMLSSSLMWLNNANSINVGYLSLVRLECLLQLLILRHTGRITTQGIKRRL